jgi:hypothetical protein
MKIASWNVPATLAAAEECGTWLFSPCKTVHGQYNSRELELKKYISDLRSPIFKEVALRRNLSSKVWTLSNRLY